LSVQKQLLIHTQATSLQRSASPHNNDTACSSTEESKLSSNGDANPLCPRVSTLLLLFVLCSVWQRRVRLLQLPQALPARSAFPFLRFALSQRQQQRQWRLSCACVRLMSPRAHAALAPPLLALVRCTRRSARLRRAASPPRGFS